MFKTVNKYFLLVVCVLVFIPSLNAQQNGLDSLVKLLNEHKKADNERLDLLNKIAFLKKDVDPEAGIKISDEAIALAQKLSTKKALAEANKNKGLNLFMNDEGEEAILYFETALKLFREENLEKDIATVYHNIALVYFELESDSLAFASINKALEYAEANSDTLSLARVHRTLGLKYTSIAEYNKSIKQLQLAFDNYALLKDEKGMGTMLNSIGINYLRLSDYSNALENYLHSIRLFEKINDDKSLSRSLTNAGIIYEKLGKYDKALEYHNRALELVENAGVTSEQANTLASISNVYSSMGNSDKALEYNERALKVNRAAGKITETGNNLVNIAINYFDIGEYEKANNYISEGIALMIQSQNKIGLATAFAIRGDIIMESSDELLNTMGISSGQKINEAIKDYKKAIELAKEIEALEKECFAWEGLSEAFKARNDFKESLNAYQKFVQLRDSITNEQVAEEVTRKEMQFEFEKKEALAAIEQQQAEDKSMAEIASQKFRKNVFITGFILLALAGTVGFISYKRNRDANQKAKEIAATLRIKDTELKALRLQMNPHFIDNALQSIQYFMNQHKPEEAEDYLVKFSSLMRAMLVNSEKAEIPLSKELETLEWYMQLENLRMTHPFTYKIEIDENLNTENTSVPPNILQPFVENSIKHGLMPKSTAGNINIFLKAVEDELHVFVEDNGVGRTDTVQSNRPSHFKKESLGIKITQERLNIINRMNNINAAFRIIDLKENNISIGTRVELNLPYLA